MQLTISLNEEQLIAQCIAGEEKSYSLLYRRYAKGVYHVAFRILNNRNDAEDIVQEAFCKAFTQIGQLRDNKNFEGWVKRIAINMAISTLRKNKINFTDDKELENMADDEINIEEEQVFQYQVEEIKSVIQNLPDGYRTIISLYLFEDLSHDEIAKELNISSNTVRSQYHRAKKKILKELSTN